MLRIRPEQMKAFEAAALQNFEDEMVAHSKQYAPRLCKVLGDEQLHVAVHSAIDRSFEYGFTNRGPIRLFIEMMFLFGSNFDADPQYPWAGKILRASKDRDQMERAEEMYEKVKDYLEKVCGPKNIHVRQAFEALSVYARRPTTFSSDELVQALLSQMTRVFPKKVAYINEEAVITLINKGRAEARKYGFSSARGQALIPILMFAFGHGCTDDQLYPWIGRTLRDERIIEPTARAERLERKAITWLDHVLAGANEGGLP